MSIEAFQTILGRMLGPRVHGSVLPVFDPEPQLGTTDDHAWTSESATAALTAAFLVALCGPTRPGFDRAWGLLEDPPSEAPAGLGALYRRGLALIRAEIEGASSADPELAARLASVADRLGRWASATDDPADDGVGDDGSDATELVWSLFFPEGVGIRGHEAEREAALRAARTVTISRLNPEPIDDAARQLLFTSNVLLTTPPASRDMDSLPYEADLRRDLERAAADPQAYWYDHPIQIGVEPAANELLYGLHGLDAAIDHERLRVRRMGDVTCVLSVSVTHPGLHVVARRYLEAELRMSGQLRHLDVHVFTEDDTARLIEAVIAPAADRFLAAARASASETWGPRLREVFGVDGAYGRHYSFLKAIAALWRVLISPDIRGTFKIDLDQVFPQEALVAETGRTAFEHLETPLWGARGVDSRGREIELGMIAGALVNERDIGRGLFTPDVDYPSGPLAPDQHVFFSGLPQALSTRAEMMERYDGPELDGTSACLQRIHVTGGTNGILVDALRRHRPFTPSFVGRAEDQAYLLSVLGGASDDEARQPEPRLAYAHAAGLIMRHDKEAFAGEAIAAAEAGKLVGDDVRILQFSAYARAIGANPAGGLAPGLDGVKSIVDPFTGCFVSRLPVTVVMLRFALRVARALEDGRVRLGLEVAEIGAQAHRRGADLHAGRRLPRRDRARARGLAHLLRHARCARSRAPRRRPHRA